MALHGFRIKALDKRFEVSYHHTDTAITLPPAETPRALGPVSLRSAEREDPESRSVLLFSQPLLLRPRPGDRSVQAPIPATAIRYVRGEEIQIQETISQFDHSKPLALLFVAYDSDPDGDALLGFSRSLRKEYPLWIIRAATHSVPWTLTQVVHAADQLLRMVTDDLELHILADGSVHVPRITPAEAPSRHQPFSPALPWKLENGTLAQSFVPKAPDACNTVVRIATVSPACCDVWAFTGNAEGFSTAVASISCGAISSHTIAHRGTLVELGDLEALGFGVHNKQHFGPLLLAPTIVVLAVGTQAFADPQRVRGLSILIVEEDVMLRSQIKAVCTRLGLNVTALASLSEVEVQVASLYVKPAFIISGISDNGVVRFLRSILPPRGRLFLWNHPEEGIPSLATHDPWALGDALRQGIKAEADHGQKTRYVPPLETFGDPPALVARPQGVFDPHRTYLLLGGIGSVGLHLALWMYQVRILQVCMRRATQVHS